MKKRLYFGHPINTYNTDLEQQLLRRISETFPDWEIENPNQKHHHAGYKHLKETTGNGMDYFLKQVLPDCHGGIFLPFRDGAWGGGIFKEAQFYAEQGLPVWIIDLNGDIKLLVWKLFNRKYKSLTREETKARIRTSSGEIIPY